MPLVLHGSSGVPDDELRAAVSAGMTKINISTHLVSVFTASDEVQSVVTWNPLLAEVAAFPGASKLFDSSQIPGEIIERHVEFL